MDLRYFKFIQAEKIECLKNDNPQLVVKILTSDETYVPTFQTEGAAGADLRSSENVTLIPHVVSMVDCGFSCRIPRGYHAKIVARSSMGKNGIIIPNAPGIIDSDYTGRIRVLLLNLTDKPYEIKQADRIAQWLIEKNVEYCWQHSDNLGSTERNSAGFGTTGVR